MNRREFLGTSVIALSPHARANEEQAPFDRAMRWAQLTLVENDPGNYDLQFWLDYFRRIHADAACLSAGGCVAYYPTKVPLHYRSKWMGNTDPFGDLVRGCRKLGMTVIARTDPHAARQDVHDTHPDWIAVDSSGNRRRHWAAPNEYWVTCALGPYNFQFMTEVTREIAKDYDIDGIFSNRWDGSGMCYCEHCRENFRRAAGMELPRTADPADPARSAYEQWRQDRLFELWDTWDNAIREVRPGARFIPNTGGGALSRLDMKRIGDKATVLFADRQARRGLMPPWMNGKNGKEYRSTMGSKPVGGIFSVGVEEPYRWKDSVQNAEEIRMWVAEGSANGLRPWFTKFSGTLHDKRWLRTVEQIYDWHWRNERYLRNQRSLARVGLVYSQPTAQLYGGQARTKLEDHALGWYQALIEARVPFDMVHDGLLDSAHVAPFRTLILPNIAVLSDTQCEQLRAFVQRGGGIVATYETSLYGANGERRSNFGLGDLFGASYGGRTEGPMQNSYLTIERDPRTGKFHPLLKGLEEAPRIINGVNRVVSKPRGSKPAYPPLTLVPSYPDLPMEQVYPRIPHTDEAEVYVSDSRPGRVVYFPWDIDRTFWEVLSTDHGRLLRNAVEWVTNEPTPVSVTGPGLLDVTVWRQKDSVTVHLVNMTNPMAMKGPVREILPIGPLELTVRVPEALNAKRVRLLSAGITPPATARPSEVRIAVSKVELHEVVAFDL